MNKNRLFLLLLLQGYYLLSMAQNFTGTVLDKGTDQTLPFAEIYFVDLKTGTTTDKNGVFIIKGIDQKTLRLQITSLGYNTIDVQVNLDAADPQLFYLEEGHYDLNEILVSVPLGKSQAENIVNIAHKKLETLQLTAPLTLAESISNIPGVEQNTTGAGIGKPVIRGLSGNRIVTYAQGIRVENQQWGAEHGLGIGEVGIESVEVIKGPASLLYGSDALGGVLYFIDERYAKQNTTEGFIRSKFLSNSASTINDIGYKINKGKIKFNLFGAYASHADYETPNGERVDNTRFDEKNLKSSLGFATNNLISNIRYSFLQNNFGITEEATYSDGINRQLLLPFQTINNHAVSIDNTYFTDQSKLNFILGYTNNYRREFEDDSDNHALGMYLNTYTYNLKWNSPTYSNKLNFVLGSQGMLQKNKNNGEEILIPDAKTIDVGGFVLANIAVKKFQFQTGIRIDHRAIDTKKTIDISAFSESYQGITFSGGAVYNLEKIKIRANMSSGFRAPNTSELLSNGVHEGTNRYERGTTTLTNENATQFDWSLEYQDEHVKFSINPFYNYIKNYIFLSPTNLVIEENPVFDYLQTNAALYGGEMGIHYHPHQIHQLHIESNLSTVFAQDQDKNALPLIPQTKINTTLSLEFAKAKKVNISTVYLQHIYKFNQNKFGIFETPTPAYHLINVGLSLDIKTKQQPIVINAGIKNLLNQKYIDHLSRFKQLEILNPGINFYIGMGFGIIAKEREINKR